MSAGALAHLVLHQLQRVAREGLLLRALAWPGLLVSATLVGTVLLAGVLAPAPRVAVDEPALAAAFVRAGFAIDSQADVVVAAQDDHWTITASTDLVEAERAEAVLRDALHAPWRRVLPTPARPPARSLQPVTSGLAALVDVLFTLYGVVVGAATVFRDRQEGVLDAELALPLPRWTHAVARLAAAGLALGLALGTTLVAVDAFLFVASPAQWLGQGISSALCASALGLAPMASAQGNESFSSRLSRALVLTMMALGLGWAVPDLGRHLPIASVTALARGASDSWAPALGAALAVGAAAAWFERRA